MEGVNRRYHLADRPYHGLDPDLFEIREEQIPDPKEGEVLVQTRFIEIRPHMRETMDDTNEMASTWDIGQQIQGHLIGEIVKSNSSLEEGTIVKGDLAWAEYNIATPDELTVVDTGDAPITTSLGVLGRAGQTAYFGMLEVGKPTPGDNVVVSSAAGATGSIAGQLAKIAGCRVIGIAGSDEKIEYITEELGMDAGINYKDTNDLEADIAELSPEGVDLYYDNVGGEITDAVISQLASEATIVLCGQIALYNSDGPDIGPRHYLQFIYDRVRVEGFGRSQFSHRFDEANERLASWVATGAISYRETITEGFENAPEAFIGLFEGQNIGRQLVQVGDPFED